ncbi:hypothetical protein CN918_29380 [Priestia megaterium]|nr:hypothetical protein CN918_29380 [Priestia megaterium]
MTTVQLKGVTLENLQESKKMRINFGRYQATINLVGEETIIVYLLDKHTHETDGEKWYKATEDNLTQALNDLRAFSNENIEKTLNKDYGHQLHIIYSADNGSEVDSIGCYSYDQAFKVAQHMLYGLKATHNTIEYLKVINSEGKLLFDLDVEQENVMVIDEG